MSEILVMLWPSLSFVSDWVFRISLLLVRSLEKHVKCK